ncbi:MAG: hypothetical protein R2753_16985 [Chitinophagales bacterium]
MLTVKRHILFLLVLSFIISCQTDIDEMTINDIVPTPDVIVRANLRGIITDQNNHPIQGAEVKAGNDVLLTDEWGYFSFKSAGLDANGTLITIKKDGYFSGSRYIMPSLKDNYIQVKLIEERNVGSFNAANGGTLDLNDGAQVIFPADIFQLANGDSYGGIVNVSAYWLDPTLPNMGELMPSNLVGRNLSNESVALASLGMMVVELSSSSGQTLKIKEGNEAELLFPIPIEMQATAPAIMPLWSFTEAQKIWIQEGQASLEGNYYRAKVSHFSWWNCDWPYPAVSFSGKVVSDNLGVADVKIRISIVDRPWSSTVMYSNIEGVFSTEVPAATLIRLEILNACNEIVFSNEIGPYSSAIDIGESIIDAAAQQMVDIQGLIVNCQQMPVNNGYAIVYFDDKFKIVELLAGGQLETSVIMCDTTSKINIKAFDTGQSLQSFEMVFDVDTAINFGEIMVCQGIEEYVNFMVDGVNYTNYGPFSLKAYEDTSFQFFPYPYYTVFEFDENALGNEILGSFNFLSYGVGYHFNTLYTRDVSIEFSDTLISGFGNSNTKFTTCTIHEFGTSVGNVVNMEFEGEWTNLSGELKNVSGNLNIKTTE